MSQLPLLRVESIGRDAAMALSDGKVHAVRVRTILDGTDDPAYMIDFLAERDEIAQVKLGLNIAQKIRDALIENGDLSYPYVRLMPQDEWERQ